MHLAQNVHARLFGLGQSDLHDFFGDALDFDVHLQRGNTVCGTGYLEVHIAKVVFVTQDVGQHRKAVVFLDQAHSDTCHVRFHRYARVHQGQATAADRCHRRRTIGLGHFRHHTHGVGKVFFAGQAGNQSTLGQTAVADFAALGRSDAAGFTGGERRHVVVQHKAVFVVAAQSVDALRVTLGTQGGNHQRLGFATREQRGTVGTGQHTVADFDGAHGAGIASVDTGLARQNLAAHQLGFDVEQHAFNGHAVKRHAIGFQAVHHGSIGSAASLGTQLLVANLVSGGQ